MSRPLFEGTLEGAWRRYRIMSFVVGTMLALLVFVAMPIQYWAHHKLMAEVVAPLHGYLYLVYLAVAAQMAFKARWGIVRILMVVCAGFVPLLAFYVEHRVTRQLRAEGLVGSDGSAEPAAVTGSSDT